MQPINQLTIALRHLQRRPSKRSHMSRPSCPEVVYHQTWTRICPRTRPLVRIPVNQTQTGKSFAGIRPPPRWTTTPSADSNPPSGPLFFPFRPCSPLLCIHTLLVRRRRCTSLPVPGYCRTSATPTHAPAPLGLRRHPPRIRPQLGTLRLLADAVHGGHHTGRCSVKCL